MYPLYPSPNFVPELPGVHEDEGLEVDVFVVVFVVLVEVDVADVDVEPPGGELVKG